MKRLLLNTGSVFFALLLALVLADVIGLTPASEAPIPCPEGSVATWGTWHHQLWNEEIANLNCRDAKGRLHGPNLNWSEGLLLGVSFWQHGEQVGTAVTFHENRGVSTVSDKTGVNPYLASWSDTGTKIYEEVARGETTHFSMWYPNGTLQATGGSIGKSAPYWLPDGSFNEERTDDAVFDGEYLSYFENGQPKDRGSYKNGTRDGKWTCSDEKGEDTVYAVYSGGRLISRTGDVDTGTMNGRCQESSCGHPKSTRVEPVDGNGQGTQSKRCSSTMS